MTKKTDSTFFKAFSKGKKRGQRHVVVNQTQEQLDKLSQKTQKHPIEKSRSIDDEKC